MSSPNSLYLHILLVTLLSVALAGCTTIRSWVCECTQANLIADNDEASDEGEWDDPSAEEDGEDPQVRAVRRDAAGNESAEAEGEDNETSYQPVDARIQAALIDTSSAERRRAASEARGVNLPADDGLVVLAGTFVRGEESTAVVVPGRSLQFYLNGGIAAQRRLDHHTPGIDLAEITAEIVQPVQLVRNGTSQVLVHYARRHESGAIDYRVAVYKVIGGEVGTIFEQTLARRASAQAPLEHVGRFRTLQGQTHRFIEWTYLDAEGEPVGAPQILRWNRWEGVFRLPTPPPTAPRRES